MHLIFFWVSNRPPELRLVHLPRNSRCQSPSESDCFLENVSSIVTSSHFGVYPHPIPHYSRWSCVRKDLIDNQVCFLWVLLGRAGDRTVFICNMTGLIISPYVSPGKTASELYPAPLGHSFPGSSAGKESVCNAGDSGLITGSGRFAEEGIGYLLQYSWASQVAQTIKNLPTVWETWVAKIPWRRERLPTPVLGPGGFHGLYSPWDHKDWGTTEWPKKKATWNMNVVDHFSAPGELSSPKIHFTLQY